MDIQRGMFIGLGVGIISVFLTWILGASHVNAIANITNLGSGVFVFLVFILGILIGTFELDKTFKKSIAENASYVEAGIFGVLFVILSSLQAIANLFGTTSNDFNMLSIAYFFYTGFVYLVVAWTYGKLVRRR